MSIFETSPNNSLTIVRPVANYGEAEAEVLEERLVQGDPGAENRVVRNLLRPARTPRAEIITRVEFRRFLRYIGIEETTEGHIEEVAEHMRGVFASASDDLRTATLPPQVRHMGSQKYLTVAASGSILAERRHAKAALTQYYEAEGRVPNSPDGPWASDRTLSGVWLARSFKPEDNPLVHDLEDLLRDEPALLPAETRYGGIAVEEMIPKNR